MPEYRSTLGPPIKVKLITYNLRASVTNSMSELRTSVLQSVFIQLSASVCSSSRAVKCLNAVIRCFGATLRLSIAPLPVCSHMC